MSRISEDKEVILGVVRGERPWLDLQQIGIDIRFDDGRCEVKNPHGLEVAVSVHDIAQGLLRYGNDAEKLRTWAFLMEAGDFMDFDPEDHPAGEEIMNALWDASFGSPISDSLRRRVEQLTLQAQGS